MTLPQKTLAHSIILLVANEFNLTATAVLSNSRRHDIVAARRISLMLCETFVEGVVNPAEEFSAMFGVSPSTVYGIAGNQYKPLIDKYHVIHKRLYDGLLAQYPKKSMESFLTTLPKDNSKVKLKDLVKIIKC